MEHNLGNGAGNLRNVTRVPEGLIPGSNDGTAHVLHCTVGTCGHSGLLSSVIRVDAAGMITLRSVFSASVLHCGPPPRRQPIMKNQLASPTQKVHSKLS